MKHKVLPIALGVALAAAAATGYAQYPSVPADVRRATEEMISRARARSDIEKYINGIDPAKKTDWKDLRNNNDTLAEKGRLI